MNDHPVQCMNMQASQMIQMIQNDANGAQNDV
jgi:hypothetical protein